VGSRKGQLDRLGVNLATSQQEQPLDNVAQLADVAGPCVQLEGINGGIGEWYRLPAILRAD